jgi:AcrR family transcriptional regulator
VTRQHILDVAGQLFRRGGHHGTGLSKVLARADAPKGSLYFHFPGGKEQLAVEAVTASGVDLGLHLGAAMDDAASPRESLHLLALIARVVVALPGAVTVAVFAQVFDGCLIPSAAMEPTIGNRDRIVARGISADEVHLGRDRGDPLARRGGFDSAVKLAIAVGGNQIDTSEREGPGERRAARRAVARARHDHDRSAL